MSTEEELIRVDDERLTIFEFGRFIERSMESLTKDENGGVKQIRLDFRRPNESPDAILTVETGDGEFSLDIEFESRSSNFKAHGHDEKKCNLIVCTQHDWKECPLPVWEILWGNFKEFSPNEGTKGSLFEEMKPLRIKFPKR